MRMQKTGAVILSLALIAGGVWFFSRSQTKMKSTGDTDKASLVDSLCLKDTDQFFSFSYSSQGTFFRQALNLTNPIATTAQDTEVKVKAQGNLHLSCQKKDHDKNSTSYILVLDDIRADQEGMVGGEALEKIPGGSIFFERNSEGMINKIRMPKEFTVGARNFVRDLLNHLSFQIPEKISSSDTWLSIEYDGSGRYEAEYHRKQNGELLALTKQRLRYISGNSSIRDSQDQLTVIPDKDVISTFQFAQAKQLKKVESRLGLAYHNNNNLFAKTTSSLNLELTQIKPTASQTMAHDSPQQTQENFYSTDLSARDQDVEIDKAIYQNTLGSSTWSDLSQQLAQEKIDASTELFLKLRALLALNPNMAQNLGEKLLSLDPESEGFLLGLNVLVNIGHTDAQTALLNILSRASTAKAMLYTLSQIGLLEHAEPRVDTKLRSIIQAPDSNSEVRLTARLALSNIARAIGSEEPERQERTTQELIQLLQRDSIESKYEALLSLGNIGSPSAFGEIKPLLHDKDMRIRLAAMKALRFIDMPAVEESLSSYLNLKYDEEERLGAVQELGYRHLSSSTIAKHTQLLKQESSEQVVLSILANLGQELKNHPELKAIFEETAENGASRNIRNYCTMKLAQLTN